MRNSKNMLNGKSRKGQEEMVGFALIIMIVAIIIIVFISLTITKPKQEVESYEVESFIQALLQYTSSCESNLEFLDIQGLISKCKSGFKCLDERDACDVLNETLKDMVSKAWQIKDRPAKGYELKVISEQKALISISDGNKTGDYKGSIQRLSGFDMSFKVYY